MGETLGKVAILLATLDGALFLDDQLRSLAAQTHPFVDIWASDDGSTDATRDILAAWRSRWKKGSFTILDGPQRGFAENFRSLLTRPGIEADYFAFCDQDDVWEADKLRESILWMDGHDAATPLLFCSRTQIVSACGAPIGFSPLFQERPSFRNALVQSVAGGNTMTFNRTAREHLVVASARADFVSHDWWSYLVVSGLGGTVHYSAQPLVRYRQHAKNMIGANITLRARLGHVRRLLTGETRNWIGRNLKGLDHNRDLLTSDASHAMELFSNARSGRVWTRLRNLRRSGVYRQTWTGRMTLWAAVATRLV